MPLYNIFIYSGIFCGSTCVVNTRLIQLKVIRDRYTCTCIINYGIR